MDNQNHVKQNILDSALELFSAKGYEGVAVSELSAAAGITKPTLYYYFGSKEGLFDAVCKGHYDMLNTAVSDSAVYYPNPENYHEDIYKTLHGVTIAYFSFAFKCMVFYRLAMANLYMPHSSQVFDIVQKYHFEQYEIIGKMFADMANYHGNLKGKDKQLAWSFIGGINAYISLMLSNNDYDEHMAKEFVHQFMHGIYA